MPLLRRAAAPPALLLVGGEGADLLRCADAECGLWGWVLDTDGHTDTTPDVSETTYAACMCHAVQVSQPPSSRPPSAGSPS